MHLDLAAYNFGIQEQNVFSPTVREDFPGAPEIKGGYMYSKNPADRLLLIDKVLRREGEEVAPGLVLEKLQPKQAIFGFRGYRYRVAL